MLNVVRCAMQAQVRIIKLYIFEMLKWLPKYCQLHVLLNGPRPENETKNSYTAWRIDKSHTPRQNFDGKGPTYCRKVQVHKCLRRGGRSRELRSSPVYNMIRPYNPLTMQIWSVWKKSSQKPGDWDLKPGDVTNKTKRADYFCHGILYPISGLLFHSFVTLLAVLRRFYFTIQVDRTVRI